MKVDVTDHRIGPLLDVSALGPNGDTFHRQTVPKSSYPLPLRIGELGDGWYIIEVKRVSLSEWTRNYTLEISDVGQDDHPSDPGQSLTLSPTSTFTARAQFDGDIDVARFAAQAGIAYRISSTGVTTRSRTGEARKPDEIIRRPVAECITLGTNGSNLTDVITAVIEELGPDDHGDNETDATELALDNARTSVRFERDGDLDVVAFEPHADRIYEVTCNSSSRGVCQISIGASPSDRYVLNGFGIVRFVPSTSAKTFVWLSAAPKGPLLKPCSDCEFKVTDIGREDHPFDAPTTLEPGAPVSGLIDGVDDLDFFEFQTAPTHGYRVDCLPEAPSITCDLRVVGEQWRGREVLLSGQAAVVFGATTPRAVVSVHLAAGVKYSVWMTDLGPDECGTATGCALSLGSTVRGELQFTDDVDQLQLPNLPAGSYRLDCQIPEGFVAISLEDTSHNRIDEHSASPSQAVTFSYSGEGGFLVVRHVWSSSADSGASWTTSKWRCSLTQN